ncbi:alpha/beta hydrolase [Polyangium sp. 15x6]|uniref:alpha/beta fold hydrolase n=1 Tax=Polyangium sp. 15x6 TaxID=3042687 RepID=UPI00249AC031|nr:alpha/beta hydrolase [Polyangium sp. 15x6]MDI3288655.1 alpha/beta hydrolase [Polyangium sp. 15x6]
MLPHHAIVTAPGASPSCCVLVLHGIFGSGGNFRTLTRTLASACPRWAFVLVDLRAHGLSTSLPPPHTLGAAADDLVRLGSALPFEVRGVMGHSFGGKVALAYAALRRGELDQLWVLDSTPSARPFGMENVGAAKVLAMLESFPAELPSRERFLELVTSHGVSRAEADWLAMNVRREGDAFRFRLDLAAIRDLLTDYFTEDLWPVVEQPDGRRRTGFVIGGRSDTVSPEDRARLTALAAKDPTLGVHILPNAGHWVHVDDTEGLLRILTAAFGG